MYKQLIIPTRYLSVEKDQSQFRQKYNTKPLNEWKELDKLPKQNSLGTPEGNRLSLAFTAGKKKC